MRHDDRILTPWTPDVLLGFTLAKNLRFITIVVLSFRLPFAGMPSNSAPLLTSDILIRGPSQIFPSRIIASSLPRSSIERAPSFTLDSLETSAPGRLHHRRNRPRPKCGISACPPLRERKAKSPSRQGNLTDCSARPLCYPIDLGQVPVSLRAIQRA